MSKTPNSSSQHESQRGQNSSKRNHSSSHLEQQEPNQELYRYNQNSLHQESRVSPSPASGAKNNSKNPSNFSRSPQNRSNKPEIPKYETKKQGNMSKIREEGIDLRKNNPLKSKSKQSRPPQGSQQFVNKMYHKENVIQKRGNARKALNQIYESDLPEEEKVKLLNANMEKLSESIIDLRQNYSQLEKQEEVYQQLKNNSQLRSNLSQHLPSSHPTLDHNHQKSKSPVERAHQQANILNKSKTSHPQSNQQILKFLLQKQRQKEERRKILERQTERQKQKLENDRLQRQKEEQEFLKWRKNAIREAGNFSQKHRKQKQSEEKGKQVLQDFKKRWQGKEHLHKKKEKQFSKKVEEEQKEIREKIMSQKKELLKPHDQAEIDEHQKWYFGKLAQLDHLKQAEKEEKLKKIEEENAAAVEHYHGHAHEIVSEQLREQQKRKILPFQKVQKIKDYKEYVREHFSPRVHKSSSSADPDNLYDPNKYMKVKRYRYYKGHSYGEIAETQPVAKNAEEVRRMGDGNMEYMKKMPKKRHQTPQHLVNSYMMPPERQFDPDLVRVLFSDVVEGQKEKKVKVKVPQHLKVQDLKMFLGQIKSVDTKLDQKQKSLNSKGRFQQHRQEQKQLNQGMVDNIERKLSLLSQL